MGRPRKQGDLLLNVPLRIMLTTEQKAVIEEAARLNQMDVATWARPILLEAARIRISEAETMKKRKR